MFRLGCRGGVVRKCCCNSYRPIPRKLVHVIENGRLVNGRLYASLVLLRHRAPSAARRSSGSATDDAVAAIGTAALQESAT